MCPISASLITTKGSRIWCHNGIITIVIFSNSSSGILNVLTFHKIFQKKAGKRKKCWESILQTDWRVQGNPIDHVSLSLLVTGGTKLIKARLLSGAYSLIGSSLPLWHLCVCVCVWWWWGGGGSENASFKNSPISLLSTASKRQKLTTISNWPQQQIHCPENVCGEKLA